MPVEAYFGVIKSVAVILTFGAADVKIDEESSEIFDSFGIFFADDDEVKVSTDDAGPDEDDDKDVCGCWGSIPREAASA